MLIIERMEYGNRQTLGNMVVYQGDQPIYTCKTLELADRGNRNDISCIPEGKYRVVKHTSPSFGKSFWIKNVPGRSEILIHVGNFYWDIRGCILVGQSHKDISGDGLKDITESKRTIEDLWELLPSEFTLNIISW